MVKQISLFLENKKGRLAKVCRTLGDAEINIRALSIADTADFGVLRLIVNDPVNAHAILKEKGFAVEITDVLAVEVPDIPGGMAEVLEKLDQAGVNVEYAYAFIGISNKGALVIIRVENPQEALQAVKESGVRTMQGEEIYSL